MMYDKKKSLRSYLINFIAFIIIFLVVWLLIEVKIIDRYYQRILLTILISMVLSVSLNLTTGALGEMVLGHAGFMAIGAYTSSLFVMYSGMDNLFGLIIGILLGGLASALIGMLVGIPALRIRGDYLAIVTLGFGEIIRSLLEYFKFTGGAMGLSGIPYLVDLKVALVITIISLVIIFAFMRSRTGRAIKAIREDEIASISMGIPVTFYKTLAFSVSVFCAGVAGSMFAFSNGTLIPSTFTFNYSIEILVIVVLGGIGSFTGSIVAAIFVSFLPEVLLSLQMYRYIIYAVILFLTMLIRPTGLLDSKEFSLVKSLDKLLSWIKLKLRKRGKENG